VPKLKINLIFHLVSNGTKIDNVASSTFYMINVRCFSLNQHDFLIHLS
jgi:hypothetical protein